MRKQSLVLGVAVLLISGGIASAQIAVPRGQDTPVATPPSVATPNKPHPETNGAPVRSGFQNGAHAGSTAGICSECYALIMISWSKNSNRFPKDIFLTRDRSKIPFCRERCEEGIMRGAWVEIIIIGTHTLRAPVPIDSSIDTHQMQSVRR